jgi:Protein of unknown function (DUF2817)
LAEVVSGRSHLTAFFSDDYATARARFRDAASAAGATLEAHPIAAPGPFGVDLTIDAAQIDAGGPDRLLIVSSGLHGVEGAFGSAVQIAWLARAKALEGHSTLLLHTLNPYGFAWSRRFDENNVDLNRNFLRAGEPFAGSPPLYATLDRLINPRHPPRPFETALFYLRAAVAILRHGMPGIKAAVAGGQFEYPFGLFFGGHAPSEAHRVVEANLPRWVGDDRVIVHVDLHTGLGTRGDVRLLVGSEPTPADLTRLHAAFGPGRVEADDPKGTAYPTRGGLGDWCRAELTGRDYQYVCAEFGTYPVLHNLAALQAENQGHHWLPAGHPARESAKQRLRETFAPADPHWRATTVARALEILDRAGELVCED